MVFVDGVYAEAGATEMIMTPIYWVLITTIVASSQLLDALTTRYFLSKGGWKEINPTMIESSKSTKSILKTKGICILFFVGFLYAISVGSADIEKFLWLSYVMVTVSIFVAVLNPSIVCYYWLKDSYFTPKQVKS